MISRLTLLALVFSGAQAQGTYVVPSNGAITFQSPNYPNEYANNHRAVYDIVGPAGSGIVFDSEAFDVETGADTLTFSEIVNGVTVALGAFSGNAGPRKLYSRTGSVTVTFLSDGSVTLSGFKIAARSCVSLECPIEHGHVQVPTVGNVTFQSRGHPNSYGNNLRIVYDIVGPVGHGIQFDAAIFDIENGDTVTFSELIDGRSVVFGTFSGRNGPTKFQSYSGSVTATFVTDNINNGAKAGFKITATSCASVACPVQQGIVTVPAVGQASFQSRGYPVAYGDNLNVVYNVVGPAGFGIQFDSEAFDLENGRDALGFSEIIDGVTVTLGTFSGNAGPRKLYSRTGSVTVNFVSDSSATRSGFKIAAQSSEFLQCPIEHGNIQVPAAGTVAFQSRGYPDSYGNNLKVVYNLAGPAGYGMQFDAESFNTDNDVDTLTLSEVINGKTVVFGTFSGRNGPREFQSFTGSVTATFVTDGTKSAGKSGFKTVARSCASLACPVQEGNVTVPADGKAAFQSRGYPVAYGDNMNVVYRVEAPVGFGIQFDSEAFDLETRVDTLTFSEIINGATVALGTFSGNAGPRKLYSRTGSVTVTFLSDASVTKSGFKIAARSCASLECPIEHGNIQVPTVGNVTFQSRGYPNHYENSLRVVYNIAGPAGYGIQFDAERFDTVIDSDILTFSEIVNGRSIVLGTFSGGNGPRTLQSLTDSVTATFVTDGGESKPGFKITAQSCTSLVCPAQQGSVTVPAVGKLLFQSRGYPAAYGDNLNVVYTVVGPVGSGIQFDAETFQTESGADSLTFSEIVGNQNVALGSFSGNVGPRGLRSRTNSVTVNFKTDSSVTMAGFRIAAQVPRS